ncbi:LOW QUALITY PROTEIN: hypothetical protein PHMEG_0006484 [Phytophthora megakarya]|uniref:Integrase catalytic domain-containing protein n=1 Tax=Phytophthora megakarya TaxID=4795 RepID=A0A225WQV7_9STRA|nr:LOW QUALITY PROTEIN: hypothetical protein PHMEG_0006484 [Phytophthora megakarya]
MKHLSGLLLRHFVKAQQGHAGELTEQHAMVDDLVCLDGKPQIPRGAKTLSVRLLAVEYAGSHRHRGEQAMLTAMSRFTTLVLSNASLKATLKTSRPNEVLHLDCLALTPSHNKQHYVLGLKDGLTHYCELFACSSPTAAVAVETMIDWLKRFDAPETWQSYNGTHFRNPVLYDASSISPRRTVRGLTGQWNAPIVTCCKGLRTSHGISTGYQGMAYLLSAVQSNLNHTQLPSLGDKAPVELSTGLHASSALDAVWDPHHDQGGDLADVDLRQSVIQRRLNELRSKMHKVVTNIRELRCLQQKAAKQGTPCKFTEDNLVLWSRIDVSLSGNKPMVRWIDPFLVVEVLSHSFIIEHLITKVRHDVNGSRLNLYVDSSLEITEKLVQHVLNQGLPLNVEKFSDFRFDNQLSRWELEVS